MSSSKNSSILAAAGYAVCAVALSVAAAESPALDFSAESMFHRDVRLGQASVAWQAGAGEWSSRSSLVGAWMDFDFEPASFDVPSIQPTSVDHRRLSGQTDWQWHLAPRWTALASLGGYSGFTGFRSAWVSEYYRQQTDGFTGYQKPDPYGANGAVGLRWEYLASAGLLDTTFGYSRDKIAPSYDDIIDPQEGLVGFRPFRSDLNTLNWRIRTENVLSRKVRAAAEFRFTSQSLRGPRFAGLGWVNYSATEWLSIRVDGGYATEKFELNEALPSDPPPSSTRFRGWWLGGTVEARLAGGWSIFGTGRRYRDNGEIENSIGFSSAAPGIQTWQAEAGVRWSGERHSVKLAGGPYFTDYAPVPFNISAFGPLYRDRTYGFFQIAYQYKL